MAGLRISLHGIELTQVHVTPPCERAPVYGQPVSPPPVPRQADAGTDALRRNELLRREPFDYGDETCRPAE